MAVLRYPAHTDTVDALAAEKAEVVSFFESIPGLIHKTWAMNESTGRGVSVCHFEDQASTDAWFGSERQRVYRRSSGATLDFHEVGGVAVAAPLR